MFFKTFSRKPLLHLIPFFSVWRRQETFYSPKESSDSDDKTNLEDGADPPLYRTRTRVTTACTVQRATVSSPSTDTPHSRRHVGSRITQENCVICSHECTHMDTVLAKDMVLILCERYWDNLEGNNAVQPRSRGPHHPIRAEPC